jgi:putative peptidoglycan lipid II flippase
VAGPVASFALTVTLWSDLGLTALGLAMSVQQAVIVLFLLVMAIAFRIMPPITLRADRADSARFLRHAIPLTVSASALQFNLLTDRAVATMITPGAVSALRYAEGVIRIPLNAIWPAWSAAIYPALVKASILGESRSFVEAASGALRYVMAIFIPIAVATAALAPLIVEVAYVRGAFDERASVLTSAALVGFAPLLLLAMASAVLTGAHNARERGMFLMAMGFLEAILNAVLNVALGLTIGVAGIALSTSLTLAIVQVVKVWRLRSLEDNFPLGDLILVSGRALIASLVVAVPIALICWELPHGLGFGRALALLVVLASAGMVLYLGVSRLIGFGEPWVVAKTLITSPRRLRPGGR